MIDNPRDFDANKPVDNRALKRIAWQKLNSAWSTSRPTACCLSYINQFAQQLNLRVLFAVYALR